MMSEQEEDRARFAPNLAGTVQESWARCLPVWSERGRVNDFPRAIRRTRYLPSFETLLGRQFVERFAREYAFLLERVQSASEFEALCAFDLLDFLVQDLDEAKPLPDCLRQSALPLPEQVRQEVEEPYYLLGTQGLSKRFLVIPRLREVGITHLTVLGESDPVYFCGWESMEVLWREIELLQRHLVEVDFDPAVKARWTAHLAYCYFLLVGTTPGEFVPHFTIA